MLTSHPEFERGDSQDNYVLTDDIATTPAINMQGAASAIVSVPVGVDSTSIAIHVSNRERGTYYQLKSATGTAQGVTVSGSGAYVLPSTIFAAWWVKLVTNADDSDLTVTVSRKA